MPSAADFPAGYEVWRASRHGEDFGRQRVAFLASHSLRVDSCRVKPRLSMHRRIMGGRRGRRSCKSAAHSVSTSNSRIGGVKLGMCIPQIPVHPLATNRTLRFSSWLSRGGVRETGSDARSSRMESRVFL